MIGLLFVSVIVMTNPSFSFRNDFMYSDKGRVNVFSEVWNR